MNNSLIDNLDFLEESSLLVGAPTTAMTFDFLDETVLLVCDCNRAINCVRVRVRVRGVAFVCERVFVLMIGMWMSDANAQPPRVGR